MPVSRMFPGVDQSFVAGLRGALSQAGVEHEMLLEPVGVCGVRDLVVERIQRLLLQSPDVVTGIMGAGLSRHVHGFFSDAGVPFIINDMGADPVMTGAVRNPFVFSNTFNLWQSMYALGYWASQHLGSRAAVSAALHEAGYGIVNAFWLGFCEAGGGTVISTEVTHRESPDQDPSDAIERTARVGADFVMVFYAGREGVSFMNAWAASGFGGGLPLLASPLMTHDFWLPRMGDAAVGVRTAFSWTLDENASERDRFRSVAKVAEGRDPAVFALLGYETGLLIAAAHARAEGEGACSIAPVLSGLTIRSPRGALTVDEASGETGSVDYLQRIDREPDGRLTRATLGALELPTRFHGDYHAAKHSGDRAGWLNPYLVT